MATDVSKNATVATVAETALSQEHLIALGAYLGTAVTGLRQASVEAALFPGGRSNLTYLITDGERQWVLRRPPLGHILHTAHDMRREYRVMEALAASDVKVPKMITFCADLEIIGCPFYLMEYIPGRVYRTIEELSSLSPQDGAKLADALVDVLSSVHLVDVEAVGLASLGNPVGYLTRQVGRWHTNFAASRSRDLPGLESLAARLNATLPESATGGIVHGDYRLDNTIVDITSGDPIKAVLDWEMSTLGDPLVDLASMTVWWDGLGGLSIPIAAAPRDVNGFPSSERLADRYCERMNIDLRDFGWYKAFTFFKLAVIFEGIHYRYAHGLTVGDGFEGIGALIEPLAAYGHAALVDHTAGK